MNTEQIISTIGMSAYAIFMGWLFWRAWKEEHEQG